MPVFAKQSIRTGHPARARAPRTLLTRIPQRSMGHSGMGGLFSSEALGGNVLPRSRPQNRLAEAIRDLGCAAGHRSAGPKSGRIGGRLADTAEVLESMTVTTMS